MGARHPQEARVRLPAEICQSRVALVDDGDDLGQVYLQILLIYDIRLRTTATANLVTYISHNKAMDMETRWTFDLLIKLVRRKSLTEILKPFRYLLRNRFRVPLSATRGVAKSPLSSLR
jgi:hypothetical protein